MEQSRHQSLAQAVRRFIRPVIDTFTSSSRQDFPDAMLGECWVAISLTLFELIVPSSPIDPAAVQSWTSEYLKDNAQNLSAQVALHQALEQLLTGNPSNGVLQYLQTQLETLLSQAPDNVQYPIRKDLSRLHAYWSEVSQFCNQLLARDKLYDLIALLGRGSEEGTLREHVIQESIGGFYQRLDAAYADFTDINVLLKLPILYLRFGLRLIARQAAVSNIDDHSRFSAALIVYPSLIDSSVFGSKMNSSLPSVPAIQHAILQLATVTFEKSIGVDLDTRINDIDISCQQALRLWFIDRAKEQERDEVANSLYRHTTTYDGLSEAEIEKQEFLALFPSFEDVLSQEVSMSSDDKAHSSKHVQAEDMIRIVDIHVHLLENSGSPATDAFDETRMSFLNRLLRIPTMPASLDDQSLPLQLSMLRSGLSRFRQSSERKEVHNFYLDSNALEAKKGFATVQALRLRLDSLIQEWPEQMILQQLRAKCDALLSLGIGDPLAKLLAALEQLLMQTEDWEMYANKGTSLISYQRSLTDIIVEWRRLELSCWHILLNSQAKTFASESSVWWFRLYETCINGALNACEQESNLQSGKLSEFLLDLIPLLDDYITSSPLGQFHARLRILQTIERYVAKLKNTRPEYQQIGLARVQRVLYATGRRFGLYSLNMDNSLREQRAVLEKEVQEYIKLASWRDVNVRALKASAQRTHHQLFKVIRKFREILKQAVWGRLQPELAGEIETMPLDDFGGQRTSTSDLSGLLDEPDANAKPHLYQLKRTFTRYDNLITTRMRLFIRASMPQCADNLAIKIILTARELSNTTIPTAAPTERREKQRKALLVRKRKAWNDLLKELKRAGFSANPKPSILQNLSDECWLREQPILVDDDSKKLSTEKIEIYFSRLQVLMGRLRVLLPNHHPDITTRELQRGIMLLQSGFSLAIDLRRGLAGAMDRFNKLLKSSRRLRMLAEHPNIVAFGSDVIHRLRFIKDVLCRLSSCLREVSQGMVTFNELKSKPSIPERLLRGVENEVEKTIMMRDRLAAILQSVQLSTQAVLLEVEYECVMEACRQISDIPGRLQDWSQRQPQIGYLVRPIIEWITSQDLSLTLSRSSVQPAEDLADRLIDNLLVVVQSLLPHSPEELAVNLEDDDHYIVQQYQSVRDLTFLLKLDVISTRVDDLIANLASKTDGIGKSLQRTIPFIEVYICLAEDQMERHCQWTKALFKLDYVISSIIHSLLEKGFCKPPDADDTEDSADMEDVVDGVGLGEGMGTKNISIEIEDESQVEGLKEEEGVDRERNKMNEDEEAIEMDDDIGGEMEDVPQEDSKDEEPEFDDSDADPEERLGKLDASDPSAVDEKLWGDESGPDNSDEADDKANRDRAEEKVGKPEVVAKEGKREAQDKKKEKEGEDAPESIGTQEEIEQMEQEIETHENEEPNVSGAPMDDYVPDADTLDLPEDLNLEEDREMESLDGEQEERQEEVPEDFGGDMDDINDQGPAEDDGMGLDGQAGGEMTEQNEPGVEEEDGLGKDVVAQADITAGQGGADTVQPADGGCQEHQQSGMQENDTVGGPGEAEAALEEVKQQTMHHSIEGTQPRIQQQFIALSAAGTGSQQGQGNGESEVQTETNPLRSLGDARKEVRQRFDEILGGENREVQENIGDTSAPSQVEYLHPGDADYDMQALGPAGEDQVANLENLNLIDNDVGSPDVHPMDSNVTIQEQHDDALRPAFSLANIVSDATVPNDEPEGHDSDLIRKQLDMGLDLSRIDTEMEDQSSQSIEMQLVEWQSLGFPEEGGEHVWRRYESITHDLAYALCEQLRLILEPTLATRLKGDYRTGKRLNMKKIIPYIASDYTKDKIWLRRTRPSQREYQILIAIDDSRSMAESHSVHLAFQTLALVTKALSRLESGEIAIANFGEAVHMLHSFDDGQFTDQAGIKVISSFRFNQKATNVLSLIDTSLAVLESARERRSMSSATAGDLWQLEIIISDGLCQDHDQLRTLLRKAEEKRVMIVFVIVDSLHSVTNPPSAERATQNSILQMDKAEYRLVDGRMELQLRKYLDSFPFDYYVVLRNVEALPDVLAGTLKQFFEPPLAEMPNSPEQDEENKALLSAELEEGAPSWADSDTAVVEASRANTWGRIARNSAIALVILAMLAFAKNMLFKTDSRVHPNLVFHGAELRSNGTHDFKRTVLMVSIDGLRADYLDRGLTPHLLAISKKGLRAKSMQPVFPTLTFPNHWSLMTGLYAESHGIVANNFWDPASHSEFHYNIVKSCWNSSWWFGEPIWETARKAGLSTANLMWPGPPKTTRGVSSTFFVPWKDKVSLDDKLEQILRWIDLPLEERPQLILGYEPSLDQAGHLAGPASALVNASLADIDLFAKNLHDSLEARNLTDIVDVVFVSDHGMTDTSHPEPIYLDDIIGEAGMSAIQHSDGWPSMGLRFYPQSNVTKILNDLVAASGRNPEKLEVYTHDTMPERYHFSHNERIAPVYVVPRIGYILTTHAEGGNGINKGSHGYDNGELSMHAIFIAHGPFSKVVKDLHQWDKFSTWSGGEGWHSTADDTYIMNRFENVEIYNLIAKLLGISEYAANTNGTRGFWDKYL
ncbi:hypothetical protein APHAL10511_008336 [Amanita phalloides]|nr:hypothetical protein APHAL10511_008336 [Amanita phalloides]